MVVQGEGAVEDDIELRGEWSSILVLCSVNRVFLYVRLRPIREHNHLTSMVFFEHYSLT